MQKKVNSSMGNIFNNYEEKLTVPRVHTAASIQLNISDCKIYPSELFSVQDQISIVSKHNTETVNHLQIVKYTCEKDSH